MLCSSCRQIERSLLLLFLFFFNLYFTGFTFAGGEFPHLLSDSRIETSLQTKRKQVCGPNKVDKKRSGSGYVLEIARSPFGIFSSNDKEHSPSEELDESKEVQESKGKGIF